MPVKPEVEVGLELPNIADLTSLQYNEIVAGVVYGCIKKNDDAAI